MGNKIILVLLNLTQQANALQVSMSFKDSGLVRF
jgi:hypothetical protein